MTRLLPSSLLLLSLAGCAAPAGGGATDSTARTSGMVLPRPRSDRDRLTAEEIQAAHLSDLYSVIQRLRPVWLRIRGRDRDSDPMIIWVFRDQQRQGGVDVLRRMGTTDVAEVRYVDPITAKGTLGADMLHGAILVFTRH
jgi:hypothetical protein